ncbi:BZ3500_MvSof-1268-A1-R1_Chr2-1g04470 [Microbotryum saponariae]|uniref:DNA topoisomerase (ATP-hydrolyzing) n=1 Tax=Microbotryum saponariae TaxID=289078 RepID=A0A2X0KKZ8_9BASI|nr:BZ3500_MvSof-1268-A1-R1_Chr2-1g04470 [Microbotryum saponariae]SCZ91786.1 BZ3501_MvSof-1269-A2-R1_Chr2-1g04126 [Microbotryum saponariae]
MGLDDGDVLLDFDTKMPDFEDLAEAVGDVDRATAWSYDIVGAPGRNLVGPPMESSSQQDATLSLGVLHLEKNLAWTLKAPRVAAHEAAVPPIVSLVTTNRLGSMAGNDTTSYPQAETLLMDDLHDSNFSDGLQTQSSFDTTSSLTSQSSRSSITSGPIELELLHCVQRFAPFEVELEPADLVSTVASQPIQLQEVSQRRDDFAPRKFPRLEDFDPGGTICGSKRLCGTNDGEVGDYNPECCTRALNHLPTLPSTLVFPVELPDIPCPKALSNLAKFQLKPLDRGLHGDARRRAIIGALEQLAVSIFAQLVQLASRAPSKPMQPKRGSAIRILLANRDKLRKKKATTFPRNIGPSVLKVIEYILDGFHKSVLASKRDYYYRAVELFGRQKVVDEIVDDIAATLCIRRSELGVGSSPKGLVSGQITLLMSNATVMQGSTSRTGTLIPPIDQIIGIRYPADGAEDYPGRIRWVLVVEKEAIFSALSSSSLLLDSILGRGVLITGKGYPDMATRHLLKKLSVDMPHTPIMALVDADPHGIEILATYACGSRSLRHEKEELVIDRMEYIGVKHDDLHNSNIDRDNLIELSARDRKKALNLLKRTDLKDDWRRELQHILHRGYKAEIEIIGSSSSDVNNDQGLLNYVVDRVNRMLRHYA